MAWAVDDTRSISTVGGFFWGGPAGFGIHSGGYNNCHLYNHTHSGASPVHWAHYLLQVTRSYNGFYEVWSVVNREHNAPRYKYYIYFEGSTPYPSSIYTTGTHVSCPGQFRRVPNRWYEGEAGASIRLVDNVGVAPETQQVDRHVFEP